MPRTSRLLLEDRPAVYHVMSRTALDGLPFGDIEKDTLLAIIKRFSAIYFCDILGFALMGNHFHLLVRMAPASSLTDDDVKRHFTQCYGDSIPPSAMQLADLRRKWTSLSEFIREIKQTFSRYYNKRHSRRGTLWGERFKSVLVEEGSTLLHCLAYIDLNPVRAGIVCRPEDYRWCSIGYHLQTNNRDDFLNLEFGMDTWDIDTPSERQRLYRQFLYETGTIETSKGASLRTDIVERARQSDYTYTRVDRFLLRTRWFSDAGIIGSKAFIQSVALHLDLPGSKTRTPKSIAGLELYALKRLAENL
ncbi:transposase [Desulfovibrio inopinatus]|uniref:transposase n=1 Tax=Desulfovibrio inopinatus TaxID=102109 RepID=UPI000484B6FB|nr:transposase [Desulfovibrio inopinatus]